MDGDLVGRAVAAAEVPPSHSATVGASAASGSIALDRPDSGLFEQYQDSVQAGGFDIPLVETTTGGSDHIAFRAHGYMAIGVTEGFASGDTTPHDHAPSDTYDSIDFDYLPSTTALVALNFARALQAP